MGQMTHLVTISPWEVLAANVLVRVLDALLKWRHVVPVLPVLSPQIVGIDASEDEARDDSTAIVVSPHIRHSADWRRIETY